MCSQSANRNSFARTKMTTEAKPQPSSKYILLTDFEWALRILITVVELTSSVQRYYHGSTLTTSDWPIDSMGLQSFPSAEK
jgi:hypothetical protein